MGDKEDKEFHPSQDEEYDDDEEYDETPCSVCEVPGLAPAVEVTGVQSGSEQTFKIPQYKGRYLVLVFFSSSDLVQSFTTIQPLLTSNGTDLVFCSIDSCETLKSRPASSAPLWSDKNGTLATLFDLFDPKKKTCLDGVVIIDDNSIIRQVMTSSIDSKELAKDVVTTVALLKKHKVDLKSAKPAAPMTGGRAARDLGPRVQINVDDLEKDWDVSADPELQKVLNVARLLGRTAPAPPKAVKRVPMFNLLPTQIRKLANPRAPIKSVMVSLQRNLAGFGPTGDIPANQRIQLENIMKKVMGVAYMPEDLTGTFTTLRHLNAKDQKKLLESDVFRLSHDDWMATPGSVKWSEGQGVFVNNYSNFLLWVNQEDQLRLVSVSNGKDLKYALLRLQKAVARIEEALKMIISVKSCQQRGFATSNGAFAHTRREVYGTGMEVVITMDLVGLVKAGVNEIDKAKRELGLKIEKCDRGPAAFTVVFGQSPDDTEEEIVSKTVEAVDSLYRMDHEFQSKLGVKLTL